MQSYWTNFARNDNPNAPPLPAWPRFKPASATVMERGDTTKTILVLDATRKAVFDAYNATRLPQ